MTGMLPTGPLGRTLALAMTVLVLATVGFGVVAPVLDWYGLRSEALVGKAALASRMEQLVARLPQLRQQAASFQPKAAGQTSLLPGESDSTAGAALQESLQSTFLLTGVALNSVETLAGEESGPYRRIRLRVSFNASWPALLGLLQAIGEASPVLLVDELQIQPALHRIGTAPGTFDVTCAIFGFRSGLPRVSQR